MVDNKLDQSTYDDIIDILFKKLEENKYQDLLKLDKESFKRTIFLNYHDGKGNRLSKIGLDIFSSFFRPYRIDFKEKKTFSGKHLLFLDRFCKLPFFYNQKYIIVFDEEVAIQFKLTDFDLDGLIEINAEYLK